MLALLSRSLKPDEISEVVSSLEIESNAGHETTTEDVRAAIEEVTKSPALVQDVQRVEAHLKALGGELEPVADR